MRRAQAAEKLYLPDRHLRVFGRAGDFDQVKQAIGCTAWWSDFSVRVRVSALGISVGLAPRFANWENQAALLANERNH